MIFLFDNLNLDFSRKLKECGLYTRPCAGNGFWLGYLLSIVFVLSIIKYPAVDVYKIATFISCGLALNSVQFLVLWPMSHLSKSLLLLGDFVAAFAIFIAIYYFTDKGFLFSVLSAFTTIVAYRFLILYILENCPKCFTIGELMVVLQGIIIFVYCSIFDLIQSYFHTPATSIEVTTIIIEAGLSHVIVVIATLHILSVQNLKPFLIVVGFFIGQMLIMLHILIKRSPVLWIINYIFEYPERIAMILYWTGCAIFAVITLIIQLYFSKKASTSTRKWFHCFAVMVYLPGLIYERTLTYLASGIALAMLLALETARKVKLKPFSDILDTGFDLFSDEKEVGGLSITPIYLLVGISAPLAILPASNENLLPLLSGLLSIGIGDSVASIIGRKFGRTKWHGSSRSVEGTVANMASQLLLLVGLRVYGYVEILNAGALVAVLINSLVEAHTDQVDNLCLPFLTLAIMLLIPECCTVF